MIDIHSRTWDAVKAKAVKTLSDARSRLEARNIDPVTTEYERGRIQAMKDILSLATPSESIPSTDPLF